MAWLVAGAVIAFILYRVLLSRARRQALKAFQFPGSIKSKIQNKYQHLNDSQLEMVMTGLKEYFALCQLGGRRMVAMPSQAVDVAWHEFILFTRAYEQFCQKCFGRFLHHTPAEAMQSPTQAQNGIKTAWRLACHKEGIDRRNPSRLPMIFSMDHDLQIPDGFVYSLNCKGPGGVGYCASHIGCGSGCAGGGDSDGGDGGCGGGCGGD
ncbi:hypothetical protein ONV78_00210 [Hahella sp. CR1]|uniref:glycine-rich domain-containing protein n=1 Tax=Hahella sp. CR1 TaxID=2992807 RepID=UPI002440F29C|nr:hypothetical protein [Hahella sp. CR1]MDG9666132.1 hypothetical protein [Hahella sp. CR1]